MSESKRGKDVRKEEKERRKSSKCKLRSVCVFGESDVGKIGEFTSVASEAACELGELLAARKINFVYGGGIKGLRGSAAISACTKGGQIFGIRVKELESHIFTIGYEVHVASLVERMGYMLYIAEAFIALPGGLETLDGISSIAYWAKLNFHKKPLGLLNVNGFYDGLLSFLDQAVEKGFLPQATRRTIISASTADELIDQLQTFVPERDLMIKQVHEKSSDLVQIHRKSSDSSQKQEPDTTLRL